jgi:hypothetical protein
VDLTIRGSVQAGVAKPHDYRSPLYSAEDRVHTHSVRKKPSQKDWLPLAKTGKAAAELPTGAAFKTAWIDFERGIRVGNLEPHERITQILKYGLEQRYSTPFVTDRWGRGVYWQWICWLPRTNREAKPVSSGTNFGCAKLFISLDRTRMVFQCGMAVERGLITGSPKLQEDWDWHRLMKQCASGTDLDREMRRLLLKEGFWATVTGAKETMRFTAENFTSARQVGNAARTARPREWAGFSLFYPMPRAELSVTTGYDFVQGIFGAFTEVVPAMNLTMQVPLTSSRSVTP